MTAERGDSQTTIPAHVEDLTKLKGTYIRNLRTDKYEYIVDVGPAGVIARSVTPDAFGGEPSGTHHGITWAALQNVYNLCVEAEKVENAK